MGFMSIASLWLKLEFALKTAYNIMYHNYLKIYHNMVDPVFADTSEHSSPFSAVIPDDALYDINYEEIVSNFRNT